MDKNNNITGDKMPKPTYQRPAGMASLFGQVEEVKTQMADNLILVHERQAKLEQLEDTSRDMLGNAQQMSKRAKGAK